MWKPWRAALLVPALALGMACGGDSAAPSTTDLSGTWTATSVQFISTTGLGTVDIVAQGNIVKLVLNADQSFQYTVTPAGGGTPQILTGKWEVMSFDLLRITPSGGTWYWGWDMAFSGNSLHLSCASGMDLNNGIHSGYDFNHDGVWEPAGWDLTFTR